ncbi:MAG: hypothetical protein AABX11_00585 [Nanoarchaeota archaeon]
MQSEELPYFTAKQIKELHDKYHPEIIFLPDTSAHGYGFIIKEAWKKAWPSETLPKMLRINVKPVKKAEMGVAEGAYRKIVDETKLKLIKFGKNGNIAVVDDGSLPDRAIIVGEKTFELPRGYNPIEERKGNHRVGILSSALSAVRDSAKELGLTSKVIGVSTDEQQVSSQLLYYTKDKKDDENYTVTRLSGTDDSFKYVKATLSNLRNRGKYIGQIIVETEQKRKSLEHKVTSVVAISGLVGGLLFLSSNITGNVIGGLNQVSSNWIGGVLFVIGLIGAFTYLRNRKEN